MATVQSADLYQKELTSLIDGLEDDGLGKILTPIRDFLKSLAVDAPSSDEGCCVGYPDELSKIVI